MAKVPQVFSTFDDGTLNAENYFFWGYLFSYNLLSVSLNFPHTCKAVRHSIRGCCDSCSKPQCLQELSSNKPQILRS